MKVAIIGLGRVGFDFGLEERPQPASHVHTYLQHDTVTQIGLCDSNKEKLAEVFSKIKSDKIISLFGSVSNLEDMQPDIVSICTPTETHKDMVKQVSEIKSVRAIMLEKPIASSLADADEIINVCKTKKITLSVNHTRRWDLMYTQFLPLRYNFNYMVGYHPGPLIRTGVHLLDLFNMLMRKKPVDVQAFGIMHPNYVTQMFNEENPDFNISGCVRYEDNSIAVLHSGKHIPKAVLFEIDMFTDIGRIKISENGDKEEEFYLDQSLRYKGLTEFQHYRTSYRRGWYPSTPLREAINQLINIGEYQNGTGDVFVNQLTSCTGEDARTTLNVALALHYSANIGNKIVRLTEVPAEYTVRSY
jgi:predicted dehydrogenase